MKVERVGILEILPDNEELYFSMLQGVIESVDELSFLQITKMGNSFHFRIATSLPKYNELLLQEILKLHNMFNIKLDLSKSIKSSATLAYDINL